MVAPPPVCPIHVYSSLFIYLFDDKLIYKYARKCHMSAYVLMYLCM